MKKLKVFVLAASLIIASNAMAQTKIGYIRIDDMVSLMPEIPRVDSLLKIFQTDSLAGEYSTLIQLYQFKDSVYRDSIHKAPAAVRKQIEGELPGLIYQIQNWQTISQQAVENKQGELLQPVYKKVYDAIRAVAKEKGYTHVFSKDVFLVAPEGDDMLAAVAAKLKVKLPPQAQTNKVGN